MTALREIAVERPPAGKQVLFVRYLVTKASDGKPRADWWCNVGGDNLSYPATHWLPLD